MSVRAFSKICRKCRLYAITGSINSAQSLSWNFTHPSRQIASLSPSVAEPTNTPPTDNASQPWRLVAAVCVQRMPTLGRIKTELELCYEAMRDEVSLERSKLSDFELEELQFERIKKARIKKAQDEDVDIKSLDDDETDMFEDLQESRDMEFQDFHPAPRLTEADTSCDMKSLDRKLDRVLYLLVRKPRQEHAWQMPQGGVEGEESLVQAAKRECREECGNSMKLKFYSNTPLAVFSYKNSPSHLDNPSPDVVGSKVFFLKAFYQSGVVEVDGKELVDHMWVTKEEMSDYVSQDYYHAVQPILTD